MTTSTTITSQSTHRNDSPKPHRLAVGIAGAAAAVVGLLGVLVITADAETAPRRAPVTIDERQLADLKAIAAWARAEGLTGLSPTSLRPIETD
jgi:hypothetical protein